MQNVNHPMIIYRMAKFKSAESHSATLAPQARQVSGENVNYMTLAPQARLSGEILNKQGK